MRPIALVREPGSRSRIRRHLPPHERWTEHFDASVDCAFPAKMPRTLVPARKDSPKKQKESRERFTADEIVCAIDAVGKAGLTVYSVEITLNGSININTTPPPNIWKPQLKANQDPADKEFRVVGRK